ncbi:hypothetical protein Cgig2_020555 [Carnegiea gigantea]|uniref:Uncharacterized protein n=1 Tax=Carnegiea gigantea TaxID=171969 RepID=A0A9Q1JR35_9CARY|nr:hypothetical protein Cgig2_020555 [Carnegiea gigantea]
MAKTCGGAATTVAFAPIHHCLSSRDFFPSSIRSGSGYSQQFRFHVAFKRSNNSPAVPQIRAQSIPGRKRKGEENSKSKEVIVLWFAQFFLHRSALLSHAFQNLGWLFPAQGVGTALLKMGIRGVTVSDVRGFGAQGGVAERHAGSEFSEDKFVSKVKIEIVLSKDQENAERKQRGCLVDGMKCSNQIDLHELRCGRCKSSSVDPALQEHIHIKSK